MNNKKSGVQFIEATDFEELSKISAGIMIDCVKQKPDALICLASGNSPARAYEIFVERVIDEQIDIRRLRILKLDEWWGVPATDPSTCEYFIQNRIIKPLGVPEHNYISFDSAAADARIECERIAQAVQEQGPMDLCILGLGKNGHLGLNEPGPYFTPHAHVAELDTKTKTHAMLANTGVTVDYGMTIGMSDIMASREVLFMAAGDGKKEAYAEFLKIKVRSDLPASILWLHPNTICVFESRLEK